MLTKPLITLPVWLRSIVNILLFIISSCVNTVIFIGECAQGLILFPFKIIQYLLTPLRRSHSPKSIPKKKVLITIQHIFQVSFLFLGRLFHSFNNIAQDILHECRRILDSFIRFLWSSGLFIVDVLISIPRVIARMIRFLGSIYFRYFVVGFITSLIIVGLYQSYIFIQSIPSPYNIGKVNFAQSTYLYDRNGKLLYEIYRDVQRTAINLVDLPPYVAQATIAIEDKNFYNHRGISVFSGIIRALKDTIATNELQGGSTITQQLVKTSLLTSDRTIERKIKEAFLALWAEQIYTKDQIMGMYLNQVPYGGSAYGIEEASKIYFGKHAKDLTLTEAATLAGLPRAPSIYSPFADPTLAKKRRNQVLQRMSVLGYISQKQYDKAINEELSVVPQVTDIRAPHFVMFTRDQLEQEYGIRKIEEGGFNVTTTLDYDLQQKAEEILNEELDKLNGLNVTNGGIVVLDAKTGEILAMVGSRDYFAQPDGAYNVTTALRQPGSSLKPILYSLALQRGYTAATLLDDSPVVFSVAGSTPYIPVNYDGRFHGKVPLRYALANSYNVPAVKTLNSIGVDSFVTYAHELGIDTWNQEPSYYGLSVGLGGAEVTLVDLAQAYSVFASQGYRREPTAVLRIEDSRGRLIDDLNTDGKRVLDENIAFIISDILSDNDARRLAFGSRSALEIPGYQVAVKTGTSNDKKDNITVGYNPDYVVAVWVGNNNNTPMNPVLTSGITGAAPIWNRVMSYLLNRKEDITPFYTPPDGVIEKPCYGKKEEYFLKGTEISTGCYWSVIKPQTNPTPTPQTQALAQ